MEAHGSDRRTTRGANLLAGVGPVSRYGERDLWAATSDALDVYQDDRTDENRASYLAAFDAYQADRRASIRRGLARAYGPKYLQEGDEL